MKDFDKDLFARLLRSARGKRSINHYGNASQVDPSYISRLERKLVVNPPSPEIIRKLAQKAAGGVSYEDFMVAAGYVNPTKDYNIFKEDLHLFEAAESIAEYSSLADLEKLRLGEIFSFRIQDDSMKADRILKGDKLLIRRLDQGEDGGITLLLLDGKELIVRRLYELENKFILQSDNPQCRLVVVEKERAQVLGQVTQVLFTP